MLTSGFFDSYDGDRKYNALDMSSIFDGIINEGVYASIGDRFTLSIKSGLKILVGSGRAWLNHTWTLNDAPYEIDLSSFAKTDPLKEKVVSILLKVDMRQIKGSNSDPARMTEIIAVSGGSADVGKAKPIEIKNPYNVGFEKLNGTDSPYAIYYYRLGNITLTPNITTLSNINIVQTVGRTDLDGPPFVSGILQVLSLDVWWENWEAQFSKFLGDSRSQFDTFMAAISTSFNQKMEDFDHTFLTNLNKWDTTFNEKMINFGDTFASKINGFQNEFNNSMNEWDRSFSLKQSQLEILLSSFNKYVSDSKEDFDTWFASIQELINGTRIEDLEKRVKALEDEMAEGGGGEDIAQLEERVEHIEDLIDNWEIESDPTNEAMLNVVRYMELKNATLKDAFDFCRQHGLTAYIPSGKSVELTVAYTLDVDLVLGAAAYLYIDRTFTINSGVNIKGGNIYLNGSTGAIIFKYECSIENSKISYSSSTTILTSPMLRGYSSVLKGTSCSLYLRNCKIHVISSGARPILFLDEKVDVTFDNCNIFYQGKVPLIGPTTAGKHTGVIFLYDSGASISDVSLIVRNSSITLTPTDNPWSDFIASYKDDGGTGHTNVDICVDACTLFKINAAVVVSNLRTLSITNCSFPNGGGIVGGGDWDMLKIIGNDVIPYDTPLQKGDWTINITKPFKDFMIVNNTGLFIERTSGFTGEPNEMGRISGNVIHVVGINSILDLMDLFANSTGLHLTAGSTYTSLTNTLKVIGI